MTMHEASSQTSTEKTRGSWNVQRCEERNTPPWVVVEGLSLDNAPLLAVGQQDTWSSELEIDEKYYQQRKHNSSSEYEANDLGENERQRRFRLDDRFGTWGLIPTGENDRFREAEVRVDQDRNNEVPGKTLEPASSNSYVPTITHDDRSISAATQKRQHGTFTKCTRSACFIVSLGNLDLHGMVKEDAF
jgi:hypothetical protein